MQGNFLDSFFRHGVMQELVQWSGENVRRLDVERGFRSSNQPGKPAHPIQSRYSLSSEKSKLRCPMLVAEWYVVSWIGRILL